MFLAAYGEWGTVWEVYPLPITNNPMFDYFFTLVLLCGVMSWFFGVLFKFMTGTMRGR